MQDALVRPGVRIEQPNQNVVRPLRLLDGRHHQAVALEPDKTLFKGKCSSGQRHLGHPRRAGDTLRPVQNIPGDRVPGVGKNRVAELLWAGTLHARVRQHLHLLFRNLQPNGERSDQRQGNRSPVVVEDLVLEKPLRQNGQAGLSVAQVDHAVHGRGASERLDPAPVVRVRDGTLHQVEMRVCPNHVGLEVSRENGAKPVIPHAVVERHPDEQPRIAPAQLVIRVNDERNAGLASFQAVRAVRRQRQLIPHSDRGGNRTGFDPRDVRTAIGRCERLVVPGRLVTPGIAGLALVVVGVQPAIPPAGRLVQGVHRSVRPDVHAEIPVLKRPAVGVGQVGLGGRHLFCRTKHVGPVPQCGQVGECRLQSKTANVSICRDVPHAVHEERIVCGLDHLDRAGLAVSVHDLHRGRCIGRRPCHLHLQHLVSQ